MDANRLRAEFTEPHLVAQTIWAGIHGVAALTIAKRDESRIEWRPIEERVEAMLKGLLHGLLR